MSVKDEGSGSHDQTGGTGDQNKDNQDQNNSNKKDENETKDDMVPYSKFRELLDEKKKKDQKLKEFMDREKAAAEARLKEEGKFSEVLTEREKRIQELEAENTAFKNHQKNVRKMNAFLKNSGGDIEEKWLSLVDLDKISFKEGTDEVDQMSVTTVVESFKKTWPEAFKPKDGKMPPPNAPNGKGYITESEWKKLPSKEMKKYKPDQIQWSK